MDVQREKYLKLMARVDDFETEVEELEKAGADEWVLKAAQEKLAEARHELARLSDGCGPGRNPGA